MNAQDYDGSERTPVEVVKAVASAWAKLAASIPSCSRHTPEVLMIEVNADGC